MRGISKTRALLAGLVGSAACALAIAAPATATAAPVPVLPVWGSTIFLVPAGHCFGNLNVSYASSPNPDVARVTFTPTGTWGSAPGCDATLRLALSNGIPPFGHVQNFTVAGGPTTINVTAGRGLSILAFNAGQPWGTFVSSYVWMQP